MFFDVTVFAEKLQIAELVVSASRNRDLMVYVPIPLNRYLA
jgi:hypothetical protein